MKVGRSKRFSAMLTPNGIHLVEYRRGTRGLQVLNYAWEPVGDGPAATVQLLARMVERSGGRGGRLDLAISGLGACHQILSLPPADPEILRPVVARELRRFYPGVFEGDAEPIVDFVALGSDTPVAGGQVDVLATAIPRPLLDDLVDRLQAAGVHLHHLTALPRTIERLYQTFVPAAETCALVLLIPRAPLLGFFHEGRLRLFSEPVLPEPEVDGSVAEVLGHIKRGALFLRQQFRDAELRRYVVAGSADQVRAIGSGTDTPVERFVAYGDSPGALAALGAALDADDEAGFNLLPPELQPPTPAERWIRFAMVIGAVLLIAAGSWWTADAISRETRAAATARQLQLAVAAAERDFGAIRPVLDERRSHAARVVLVDSLVAGKAELLELAAALATAAPEVQIHSLTVENTGLGWSGTLQARATSYSGPAATAAVQAVLADLQRSLRTTEARLGPFAFVDTETENGLMGSGGMVAVEFEISFIVGGGGDQ